MRHLLSMFGAEVRQKRVLITLIADLGFITDYLLPRYAFLPVPTQRFHICRADFILFIATFLSECLCLSQLVFYEEQRTWNEAYTICEKNGGLLMSVDSQEKYNLLDTFSNEQPWNSVDKLDKKTVWIGLHYTDSKGTKLAWADCSSVSWTNWHPSQPKSTNTNKCVYLQTISSNFWTDVCSSQLYFICENLDSNPCTSSLTSCYEATIGVTGQSVDINPNNNPSSSCYERELTTSTEDWSITPSTHLTTDNLPQFMSSITLDSKSISESTTLSTYTTNSVGECSCKCVDDGANMTETVLQSKIEARKKFLTVDKQSLSSTIRKKESAEDPRPSAKGIGVVGVVFIIFIIGGIVIPDLYSLYIHVSRHLFKAKQYSKTNDKSQANNECIEQNVMVLESTTE